MHFHVAHGLAGYGPYGSESYDTGENWEDVADLIRDRLRGVVDRLAEDMSIASERQDYKEYHDASELAASIETLAANLDNSRSDAPLYGGDTEAWRGTIADIVSKSFPLDLDTRGANRLYAWVCTTSDAECDHFRDDNECEGHESLSGPTGVSQYCDGSCRV